MAATRYTSFTPFDACPECSGPILLGTCQWCGLVIDRIPRFVQDDFFLNNVEGYEIKQSKQFVAETRISHVATLHSEIDFINAKYFVDCRGVVLPVDKQKLFYRLRRLNFNSFEDHKQSRTRAVRFLKSLIQRLPLYNENVMNDAIWMFEHACRKARIMNHTALMVASFYIATRKYKLPLEVSKILSIVHDTGHRCSGRMFYKNLYLVKNALGMRIKPLSSLDYLDRFLTQIQSNSDCIKSVASRVELGAEHYFNTIKNIILKLMENPLIKEKHSRSPVNFTSALIYFASIRYQKEFTARCKILAMRQIAAATGIPEYSLRDIYDHDLRDLEI